MSQRVIRAATGLNGTVQGFQACQGPGGRMVALMQMNDTNENGAGDNFLSMSSGDDKSSAPINITNNAGRKNYVSKDTSAQSHVALQTGCEAGGGAVAFDKDGHLLLVVIKKEFSIVHSTAFGVNLGGGGSTTPTLRFLGSETYFAGPAGPSRSPLMISKARSPTRRARCWSACEAVCVS